MNPDNFSVPNKMFSGDSLEGKGGLRIQVVGVGGAGSNVVDCLNLEIKELENLHFSIVNTDMVALENSPINNKTLIGRNVTRGLGTGGEVEFGIKAADEDRETLRNMLLGPDIVFIISGFGGGTGTGVAPILAEVASSMNALVVSFVTLPFTFEGGRKKKLADQGLVHLRKASDAVIPLPNDILLQGDDGDSSVLRAFSQAKDWVRTGIDAILSLISNTAGLCNIDYSTLRNAFVERGGKTLFGVGRGSGENASSKALENLMLCPLLRTPENSLKADNLIVNITGGPNLCMNEVNTIMTFLREKLGGGENTVFGAVIDEKQRDTIEIFILGTTNLNKSKPIPSSRLSSSQEDGLFSDEPNRGRKKVRRKKRDQEDSLRAQGEFGFLEDMQEDLGYFDKTDKNLFNGENLDIPTYLRRGIKILLK